MDIPEAVLQEMYYKLVLCRRVDEKMLDLNSSGVFSGWLHLASGQEAMPVALSPLLRPGDFLKQDYRGAYFGAIAKGIPLRDIYAPIFGRKNPGRAHLPDGFGITFAPDLGLLGISGSLGEDVPIYAGAALSAKQRRTQQIAVCFFGDGTANKGPVHESMNLAAVWALPVVFICTNNQYALSTAFRRGTAVESLASRAAGYGMPGIAVDGNDVLECYRAAREAVERARSGGGPSFIENNTYRVRGHWEGDPENYRSREEVEAAKKRDPLPRFQRYLLDKGALTQEAIAGVEARVKREIEDALAEVRAFPPVTLDDMLNAAQVEG